MLKPFEAQNGDIPLQSLAFRMRLILSLGAMSPPPSSPESTCDDTVTRHAAMSADPQHQQRFWE